MTLRSYGSWVLDPSLILEPAFFFWCERSPSFRRCRIFLQQVSQESGTHFTAVSTEISAYRNTDLKPVSGGAIRVARCCSNQMAVRPSLLPFSSCVCVHARARASLCVCSHMRSFANAFKLRDTKQDDLDTNAPK